MSKWVVALVVAVALAACQQPGARKSTHADTDDALAQAFAAVEREHKDPEPSAFFKTKMKDVIVKLTDRMLTACLDATEAKISECFHERMLVGFDRDGTLEHHCPLRANAGDDLKCIMFGGLSQQIASKLTNDAMSDFDWSDPEESGRDVMRQFVLQQMRDCLSSGSASDPLDCFVARVTSGLELTSEDLDPCTAFKDDDFRFGNCIGEVFAYKYMSAGVERM
jgi:hypothetical protein